MSSIVSRALAPVDERRRLRLLTSALALGLLCCLALSRGLWIETGRMFPTAPVSDALPPIPFPLDYIWFSLVVALLVAVAVVARPRKFVAAFLVVAGALCLWDQGRWQPWFFQFYFMLAALCARRKDDGSDAEATLDTCRLIVASIYFWSGVQKASYTFVAVVMPLLMRPYLRHLPQSFGRLATAAGLVAPLVEAFVGVGLLTRRFRRAGLVLALASHAFILALLVPVRANTVVWPWNVAMAASVVILFGGEEEAGARRILFGGVPFSRRSLVRAAALLLFGVMPLFNFFDLWDSDLSAALYSENIHRAEIRLSDALAQRLPGRVRADANTVGGESVLNVSHWSQAELNVPPYPEPRVYREAARWVCSRAEHASDAVIEIRGHPRLLDGARPVTVYDCGDFGVPR